jgi:hypothetical protein
MNLRADSQVYDILLRDMIDKKCGHAAITNEDGIMWQGKTVDCEI